MPDYVDDANARLLEARAALEAARTAQVPLVETGQLYALYAPGPLTVDNAHRAIVSFTSTALRAYNDFVDRNMETLWPQKDGGRAPAPKSKTAPGFPPAALRPGTRQQASSAASVAPSTHRGVADKPEKRERQPPRRKRVGKISAALAVTSATKQAVRATSACVPCASSQA